VNHAIHDIKDNHTIEYLGISPREYMEYLESMFTPEMTRENHGVYWHIDHITPIMYNNPTDEERIQRLHYTNTQPLIIGENLKKGNRYIG
jgi:hypothetical protein